MANIATPPRRVVDRHGVGRPVRKILRDERGEVAVVTTPNGRRVLLPVAELKGEGAILRMDVGWSDLERDEDDEDEEPDQVIPVLEEQARVSRRPVLRGKVRVRKVVHRRQQVVDEPLFTEQAVVERVPVNQYVDAPPPVRREGDHVVVPCLEEVLVVEKRLLLREEVRVRLERRERRDARSVTLRREDVVVEREDDPSD